MIRVEKQEKIASNGVRLQHIKSIEVCGKKLNLPDVVSSYIELQDKVIILTLYPSAGLPVDQEDIDHNIFCYNKIDGSLKWQVESKEGSPYVGVSLNIPDSGERNVDYQVVYKDELAEVKEIFGITLNEKFRSNIDSIRGRTFSCNGYEIDIETGKVKFLYQGK